MDEVFDKPSLFLDNTRIHSIEGVFEFEWFRRHTKMDLHSAYYQPFEYEVHTADWPTGCGNTLWEAIIDAWQKYMLAQFEHWQD